jgi:preprotein translocase subunit SecD
VTFGFALGQTPSQETLGQLSRYLLGRSQSVLGVDGPRVESVSARGLILLLPGRKVRRGDLDKLLERTSLEFYRLANVATKQHPERPWRIRFPKTAEEHYTFIGPDAQRLVSANEAREVLKKVVGAPANNPLLTGEDVMPDAGPRELRSGWAVSVRFTRGGAKRLSEFTKHNPGEYLALFYNGYLMSAAAIDKPIEGGEAMITGFRTLEAAETAAGLLNSGVLPVPVTIDSVSYY